MSAWVEIEQGAASLPLSDKESLLTWLQAELSVEKSIAVSGQRVSGLGKGEWWVADDFDAPLLDEFWLEAVG